MWSRCVAFAVGYLVAVLCVWGIPRVLVHPSEDNLARVYHDDAGVCYRYQREACECP